MRNRYTKCLISSILSLLMSTNAWCQTQFETDVGIGPKNSLQSVALFPFLQQTSIGFAKIKPKLGLRMTNFLMTDRKFQTANNSDRANNGIDIITVDRTQHLSLNVNGGLEVLYSPFLMGLGFAIDLVGYGYAPSIRYDGVTLDGGGMNALRWTYNDMGSLYSETYVVQYFNETSWAVKFGTTHSVNQVRATESIPNVRTKRFLSFSDTIFLGLIYIPNDRSEQEGE